ncbi:MAG: hypothetical protein H0W88_05520 [Parachlamydiaceae bacterium]|nr:hypothetical protein [Parachlamydiaceae bacterium]
MLDFFRKYQWYFFLVITFVIVISFSFFGTSNSLSSNPWGEQIAFTAVNGKEITRFEMDDMTSFISTDADDKMAFGNAWGLNFLNDGVIRKDFLDTGLALELASFYRSEIQDDLQKRLAKEKKYKPYTHPQARFISTENTWNYFVPEMTSYFGSLKNAENATDADALTARTKLYLAEKQLPANTLRQVLRYQEKQYNWLTPDPDLDRTDLSLFGYHTLEDWYGPRFVRIISQFIINTSMIAESKGYEVSRAEVLADLIRNTDLSFQQSKNNPNFGVATPEEYFNEQLRRLNLDQTRAIRVWRQVMLFRRYFQDVGNSALVDALTFQKFNDYTKQNASMDLYRLPSEFHVNDYATLQKLEIYLNAISKRSKENTLDLPTNLLAVADVTKTTPELVQNRYLLEIAQVNKKALQGRVGIKETWNWEVQDQNWATLKKQFPELGVKKDGSREERFAALDDLDATTRARVDVFARSSIVDAHPEWISQALESAPPTTQVVGLRPQGGKTPFEGLNTKEKREELIKLLDQAPVGSTDSPKLNSFTIDQQTFYKIKVLDREAKPEILTFAEANIDGTLEALSEQILQKHYAAIRDKNASVYKKEDGSWKEFSSVRDLVADQYFDKTIKALQKIQDLIAKQDKESANKDQLASLRFYTFVQGLKTKLEKDPTLADKFLKTAEVANVDNKLNARAPLTNQWMLEKTAYTYERGNKDAFVDATEAFALPDQSWSSIKTPANGDVVFFQMKEKGANDKKAIAVAEQTANAHTLLSAEAQRVLMRSVLKYISEKGAISLAYMNVQQESQVIEPDPIVP